MQEIGIRPDGDSGIGGEGLNLNGLIDVDDILAFMAELQISLNHTLTRTRFLPMTLTTYPT